MKRLSFVLFLFLFLTPLFAQQPDSITYTQVGDLAPAFKVTTIDGKELDILKLKGKVVLINFFAIWCSPCMAEMPHLEKEIWQKYRKRGDFVVLAIGREHTTEQLIKFNQKKKFTFYIAPDHKRGVYSLFAKKMIPRNYLIDREGKIAYQAIGYNQKEFEHLQKKIKELLK